MHYRKAWSPDMRKNVQKKTWKGLKIRGRKGARACNWAPSQKIEKNAQNADHVRPFVMNLWVKNLATVVHIFPQLQKKAENKCTNG